MSLTESYLRPPCKNCPDRQYDCHAKCYKYKKFKEESDRMKEQTRKEKMRMGYI